METDEIWNVIYKDVKYLSELFDGTPIFIRGVASYLYATYYGEDNIQAETSHDADLMVTQLDLNELRELYDVTRNNRLCKSQFILHKNEYDVYVENIHSLSLDYSHLFEDSILINRIRVPSLEHLLILKMAAFKDRISSDKGKKDERDLIKILYFIDTVKNNIKIDDIYLLLEIEDLKVLEKTIKNSMEYNNLTNKNAYKNKAIKSSYLNALNKINQSIKELETNANTSRIKL